MVLLPCIPSRLTPLLFLSSHPPHPTHPHPPSPHILDASDVAADPAHLYSFVHQLGTLQISPPPPPTSVCCSSFELTPFRSLYSLKVHHHITHPHILTSSHPHILTPSHSPISHIAAQGSVGTAAWSCVSSAAAYQAGCPSFPPLPP